MAGHEFSHGDVLQGREVLTVRRMGPEAGRVNDLLGASCERVVEGEVRDCFRTKSPPVESVGEMEGIE